MVTADAYEAYTAKNLRALKELLDNPGTRPVLFLGCGITKRYLGAPSWLELLAKVASHIGIPNDRFNFLSQRVDNDPASLGSELVDPVHEWAWAAGKNYFPPTYFSATTDKALFLKFIVGEILKDFGKVPDKHALQDETDLLRKARPHAIVTTNFDTLVEELYPDYELVVGERIIPMSMSIMGEIYKIHGSVSDPSSLVLTGKDYDRFRHKRRYISSKLMTYFAEYPVIIMGYGLGDPNVNAIISDLGEAMQEKGGLLDNVYYIEWVPDVLALPSLKEEHAIPGEEGSHSALRVKTIVTSDFGWLLTGLADVSSPVPMNTKVLRHLAARVVDLVRVDVPKNPVELDYKKIESLTDDQEQLAMVLGIGNVTNPNIGYPYVLTQVGQKLGYPGWHGAKKLCKIANETLGFDIQAGDNEYHMAFKTGTKNAYTSKYSKSFVELLREFQEQDED